MATDMVIVLVPCDHVFHDLCIRYLNRCVTILLVHFAGRLYSKDCAFPVVAARLWNVLPPDFTVNTFVIKAFTFSVFCPPKSYISKSSSQSVIYCFFRY